MNLQAVAVSVPSVELTPMMSDRAYGALRSDILAGEIEPGAKLKMEDLQRRYQFSSSPLREALNRLAAEQIVIADGRRGFRAAPVSLDDLQDITNYRLVLEINGFEMSMQRGTTDWEVEIMSALHRLVAVERALPAGTRSWDSSWIDSHKTFHAALLSACGSERLLAACSAMFDQSQRYRSLSAKHRDSPPRSARAEHRRLLEVALHRDREAGRKLLGDHIQKTADHVAKFLS